jgi:hypothetical protein
MATHRFQAYQSVDSLVLHHHTPTAALCHGRTGAESFVGVLAQAAALAHLNLSGNKIGAEGTERLAEVLARCAALAHLDLSYNWIGI